MQITDAGQRLKTDVAHEFLEWVFHARELVDAHFPNDTSSAHSSMIVETAKSMMMMHKMGEIEKSVHNMTQALENLDRN
jgi:hypothetical protein